MTPPLEPVAPQGVSMRVVHPTGWTFEVVGPEQATHLLWERFLEFLQPRVEGAQENVETAPAPTVGMRRVDPPEPRSVASARVGDPKPEDWQQARTWWNEGMFVREIAERLGVTESAVYYQQRTRRWPERPAKRGVKPISGKQTPPKESKLSPGEWEMVRVRYTDTDEPLREIARQFSISHVTILAHAEAAGWPPRVDAGRGRKPGDALPRPSGPLSKTATCANCGVGTPAGQPCVMCGHPMPRALAG